MSKRELLTLALTVTCAVVALSRAGDEGAADRVPVEVFRLPPNMTFERHVVGGEGVTAGAANERLIYSNTLGTFAADLGANWLLADDIATTAPNGCKLRRFEFPVVGKVDPNGTGGPYSVDFALYSNCPDSVPITSRPGPPIENSAVHIDFPDDAPRLISFVPPEAADVVLLTNVWLGVKFSRDNAGVIVGAPAMVGFSADSFDCPGCACNAYLGGFGPPFYAPHASFNAEIYADADCPEAFVGYKNNEPSGSPYNPGGNVTFADDIQLGVGGCQMIAYEVAIKGIGFYTFDLRRACDGNAIPGTQNSFTYYPPATDVKIVRFSFDPPIVIPRNFWFAAKVTNDNGGVVVTGQLAVIGWSEDLFGLIDHNGCSLIYSPIPHIDAAANLAITCAGAVPIGACCDMALTDVNGEAVCREVPQMNCPWPWPQWNWSLQPQWIEGATCDPDPFPLSCGLAACCRPDDVCENLTLNQCNAVPPLGGPRQWQIGRYCGVDWQHCPLAACLAREGECVVTHDSPGCASADCCTDVCRLDPWCCQVEWDRLCVELAGADSSCGGWHDDCWSQYEGRRALTLQADSSTFFANTYATVSESDPGFCCRSDTPGSTGFGTVWFKFTATDTSAKISTCNSDPGHDSLFQVFAAGDSSTEERACATLAMIACSDDVDDCGAGRHGKICVRNLTPGQTYYVMVASKTPETKGVYQLDIRSPCSEQPIWNASDCNGNGTPDGCEIARGAGTDCNENGTLDECEITSRASLDCNSDLVPDECTSVLKTLRPDSPSLSFGVSVAVDGEWVLVGEPYPNWNSSPSPGAAYLFRRTGVTWERIAKLSPPEPWIINFGGSVAMASGHAFVTARELSAPQSDVAGAVYEFACDESGCRYRTKIKVTDPADPWRVVCRVSVSDDRAAVSACWTGDGFEDPVAAAVYVFERDGPGWRQVGKLTSSAPREPSVYGNAISLDGDWLAIGSGLESYDDIGYGGVVYLYKRVASTWVYAACLEAPAPYGTRYFGTALDLRDDHLVVAAVPPSGALEGAKRTAFVFHRIDDTWLPDGSETVFAGTGYIDEGSVRFINNGVFIMGVSGGGDYRTFAYVIQRVAGGGWRTVRALPMPAGFATYDFAEVVGGSSNLAAVGVSPSGTPETQPASGVYLYAFAGGDCNENGVTDGCDIRDGTSADCNGNRIPDECETFPPFDYDFDGDVDLIDLAGFQRCFTGPGPATVAPCCRMFDSEPDGDVDGGDFVAFNRAFAGP